MVGGVTTATSQTQNQSASSLVGLAPAIAAGSLVVLQTQFNGLLGAKLGSPIAAAAVSFWSGVVFLTAWCLVARRNPFAAVDVGGFRAWWFAGGATGALVVSAAAFGAPIVGVSLVAVTFVAGQTLASLLFDQLGLGPHGHVPVSVRRIVAALLAIGAVAVGSFSSGGTWSLSMPVLALLLISGVGVSLGAAANGRLRLAYTDAKVTAIANFCIGGAIATVLLAAQVGLGHATVTMPVGAQWWEFLGGPVGAIWIAATATLVARLGILRMTLGTIAGQLIGALVLEAAFPISAAEIGPVRLLAVAITLLAVVLESSATPMRNRAAPDRADGQAR
jgi:transporter family-2 protein